VKEEKEICDMLLDTIGKFMDAQNVGIEVLDKYGDVHEGLVPKLREIAFHVQSLARGWASQQQRADECYSKYNQRIERTQNSRAAHA